jgi:transcriptional regulator with XRE-family HTH domain
MFGPVVREARASRGLTQTQLAEISGIAQSNISAIEAGRREPTASTLHQLLTSCGYELVARAAADFIRFPVVPNSEPEPIVSSPSPVPRNAKERNQMLMAALQASEALVRAKARR